MVLLPVIFLTPYRLTVRLWRGETPLEDEDSVISNAQLQVALRHLASDTVPNLIMYMGKISTNTEGMSISLLMYMGTGILSQSNLYGTIYIEGMGFCLRQ